MVNSEERSATVALYKEGYSGKKNFKATKNSDLYSV